MENVKNKMKLLEISQQLKKDNISYNEAKEQILKLDKKEFICCDNINIENTRCKYPNGLPLETIEITYCSSCDKIHDVSW
jgi:hypothetical protein